MSKYTVIGKPNCPQCDQVKNIFNAKQVDYNYQEIGKDITLETVKTMIPSSVRSVPIVFQGSDFVGGIREAQMIAGGA